MGSILSTFLFIIIVYYIFKRVVRLFNVSFMEDSNERTTRSNPFQSQQSNRKKEGDVEVQFQKRNESRINPESAESIDFEEID